MKHKIKISSIFPKHLFWDVRLEELDSRRDMELIIPRALFMSDKKSFEKDIARLEDIYQPEQIIENLQHTKERISNEVCELISKRYNLPSFHRFSLKK
ncbi:MAG: DUF6922 domain-containing protein [Arachidicoccus sp.]